MLTRTFAWEYEPYYLPDLPPPVGHTALKGGKSPYAAWRKNGQLKVSPSHLKTSGALTVTPRYPKLMMDPSDPATWQRPYRFT